MRACSLEPQTDDITGQLQKSILYFRESILAAPQAVGRMQPGPVHQATARANPGHFFIFSVRSDGEKAGSALIISHLGPKRSGCRYALAMRSRSAFVAKP